MKTLVMTALATSLVSMNVAFANVSGAEIFESIDGESYGMHIANQSRTNYDLSPEDMTSSTVNVGRIFEGIDGESYGQHVSSSTRINYDLSADDMAHSSVNVDAIFKAIDGENYSDQ